MNYAEPSWFKYVVLAWRSWRYLALSVLVGGALGTSASFAAPTKYRADTLIIPAPNPFGTQSNPLSSQLGGLAQLAGLSAPVAADQAAALATLDSRALLEEFINKERLLPLLFSKRWDSENNQWKGEAPSIHDAIEKFRKIYRIQESKKSGLVRISVDWSSPDLAAKWATGLVALTNAQLRSAALAESEQRLRYLQEELQKTSINEVRQSIFSLIENELKRTMLARGSSEFAFKTIDPAVASDKVFSPRRHLWVLAGAAFGLALTLLILFVPLLSQDLIRRTP